MMTQAAAWKGEREMKREEKEKAINFLESLESVEVVKVGRKYATIRVRDIYGQPRVRFINLEEVDETSFFGA